MCQSGRVKDYDVCVIGAGYGGATVAALLAHEGRRVALIEKTKQPTRDDRCARGDGKPPARLLVGCDAGGRGAGTHQAVDSGFNVAEMVHGDLGT